MSIIWSGSRDHFVSFCPSGANAHDGVFPLLLSTHSFQPTSDTTSLANKYNVWFMKIRTTHNLSLCFYEYVWIKLLYGHLVYFILKVLIWEICNMKWVFAKKVIIESQRQFMYGSNFSDEPNLSESFGWMFSKFGWFCSKRTFHFSGYTLNLKALIKVSKTSWTSQLSYINYILWSSIERKFRNHKFISPKKHLPKKPRSC